MAKVEKEIKEKRETPAQLKKQGMEKFVAFTQEKGGEFLSPLQISMEPGEIFVGELISVELIEKPEKTDKAGKITQEKSEYPLYHFREVGKDYYSDSQNRGRVAMSGGVNFADQMINVNQNNIVAVLFEGKVKTSSGFRVNVYKVSNLSTEA